MHTFLSNQKGVLCIMDIVLVCYIVHGKEQSEHHTQLKSVLKYIEAVGMTLK